MTSPYPPRPTTLPTPRTPVDLREAALGNLGLWVALGAALLVLGFAAGIALDQVPDGQNDGTPNDVVDALPGIPVLLVALLPFVAAPVLAMGTGAWSGHATRNGRIGAITGALGGLVGPIVLVLLAALGLSFGAGAAGVDLDLALMPYGLGSVAAWRGALPYLLTGTGLLVLLASLVSGALAGGIVGSLLDGRTRAWGRPRDEPPQARPPVRI